ncbi:MAG TPA: hypothetical protein VNI83_05550, partial [Vicinamibacterales bacterium]|nr:hypothetical protein [Vicinamibacterales bacterium]
MTAGLELLAELVAIPSHASQPEGIRRIGELVGAELRALGFQEVPPEPPSHRVPSWAEELLSPEASFDALLDPIVLRRPGTVPGRLLLLGDLDMALVTTSPRLVMDGKRALGPAVADMKGGLVVMVDALRQLGSRAAPEIVIVLSRDEQAG